MRLIDIESLKVVEIGGAKLKELSYAILSHRWEDEEVSLQDFINLDLRRGSKGFHKIQSFCNQLKGRCQYAWVDTCCIDKTSSAELSEAINSMYRWYEEARHGCYAYLFDVEDQADLAKSQWFTRGWTLQELLAPSEVYFYNKSWKFIGTKASLKETISNVTGIDIEAITGKPLDEFSVAQRMSWAADRETTREEDIAYCLMGMFQVNMPMLYGEGDNAFARLQEEIIRHNDDRTIFAWGNVTTTSTQYQGLLAPRPSAFKGCRDLVMFDGKFSPASNAFSMTNIGISINLRLIPAGRGLYTAVLGCDDSPEKYSAAFGYCVVLQRLNDSNQYVRVISPERNLVHVRDEVVRFGDMKSLLSVERPIFVRQRVRYQPPNQIGFYGFRVEVKNAMAIAEVLSHDGTFPGTSVQKVTDMRIPEGYNGTAGVITFSSEYSKELLLMKIGFDIDFHPVALLMTREFKHSLKFLQFDAARGPGYLHGTNLNNVWLELLSTHERDIRMSAWDLSNRLSTTGYAFLRIGYELEMPDLKLCIRVLEEDVGYVSLYVELDYVPMVVVIPPTPPMSFADNAVREALPSTVVQIADKQSNSHDEFDPRSAGSGTDPNSTSTSVREDELRIKGNNIPEIVLEEIM